MQEPFIGRYIMFDVDRVMQVMSEILSDRYGCKITLTAIPKDQAAAKASEKV